MASMDRPADYRSHAAFLIGASAVVLLLLGAVLQVAVWESRDFYRSQRAALPGPAETFFDMFGRRPDSYLAAVVFWLWWPMVAAAAYCHHRHRSPQAFAVAFLYWFACCWLVAATVLTLVAVLCVYPRLGLLRADLQGPPGYMWVVSAVSWSLPLAVVIFAVVCWLRFRSKTSNEAEPSAGPGPGG